MNKKINENTICPSCKSNLLVYTDNSILCQNCNKKYPVVKGIPVLIDEENSIFSIESIIEDKEGFFDHSNKGKMIEKLSRILPSLQLNMNTKRNYSFLKQKLQGISEPNILIIGAGTEGRGVSDFIKTKQFTFVMSDVCLAPVIDIVIDAHSIPYSDSSFDCVIVQAVLEHVLNPQQCLKEILRVIKPDGYVYAETPFMQQVHGGAYDFTRFSKSGHRWLFKDFSEIFSGPLAGPASALTWSIQHFILSLLPKSHLFNLGGKLISHCVLFWIKYFDYLMKNPVALDGACSFFFLGQKGTKSMHPKDMKDYYTQRIINFEEQKN